VESQREQGRGIDEFGAVINPPQAAILAVGAIRERPVAIDEDTIMARPVMTLTLAAIARTRVIRATRGV
jgi:pyruvate/2-oxoglutarate dehydrogenase complex dihydrolipoamide acyltransferase (E2) component